MKRFTIRRDGLRPRPWVVTDRGIEYFYRSFELARLHVVTRLNIKPTKETR